MFAMVRRNHSRTVVYGVLCARESIDTPCPGDKLKKWEKGFESERFGRFCRAAGGSVRRVVFMPSRVCGRECVRETRRTGLVASRVKREESNARPCHGSDRTVSERAQRFAATRCAGWRWGRSLVPNASRALANSDPSRLRVGCFNAERAGVGGLFAGDESLSLFTGLSCSDRSRGCRIEGHSGYSDLLPAPRFVSSPRPPRPPRRPGPAVHRQDRVRSLQNGTGFLGHPMIDTSSPEAGPSVEKVCQETAHTLQYQQREGWDDCSPRELRSGATRRRRNERS